MIKIAIDGRMAYSSGIGVYLRNMLINLVELEQNWRFQVYGWPGSIESMPKSDNIEHRSFDCKIYSVEEQLKFPLQLDSDASAVYVPHYNIPVLTRKPVFTTIHDVAHLAEATATGGLHRQAYARAMFSAVRRRARSIFFVSEFSRSEFNRVVGVPLCCTYITPNALSPIWREAGILAEFQRPIGSPYLIYVGNVKPHKNLRSLLDAMHLLPADLAVKLVIVGKQDGFLHGDPAIVRQAAQLGSRVHFTGAVSDAELVNWVRHAAAMVFPSLYEGFGIPPLEAMAMDCPTLVSDIPAVRETCGMASAYFNPKVPAEIAGGIMRVLTDREHADELRRAGRARVMQYDWANSARVIRNAMSVGLGLNCTK